jgi:PPOX class probable F420-dependent enzyme
VTAPLPDDLKKYIDDTPVFACITTIQPDGSPQQSITWITRDGDDLLISTTMDRQKQRNIRRDPRVSVMINPPNAPYTYAEVRGLASLTTKGGGQLIDNLSRKYTGKDYADFNPASKDDAPRVVVRITPHKVVGSL